MKLKKKPFSLVIILIIALLTSVYADTLSSVSYPDKTIVKGDTFTLTLNFDSALDPFTTLVNKSTNSFMLSNKATKIDVSEYSGTTQVKVDLTYLGSGNTFNFEILNGEALEYSDSVLIAKVVEESSGSSNPTPTDTTKYKPVFSLKNGTSLGDFKTGTKHTLNLDVVNDKVYGAKNITLKLEKNEDVFPIIAESANLTDTLATLNGNKSDKVTFDFYINPAAAPKTYAMNLVVDYENVYGNAFSQTLPVFIKVVNNEVAPIVGVKSYSVSGGGVSADQASTLTLSLTNGGTLKANKIMVQLTGTEANGIRLSGDLDTKSIFGSMGPNMTADVAFQVIGAPSFTGTTTLTAKITYYDDMGLAYEKSAPVYVTSASKTSLNTIDMTFDKGLYALSGQGQATIGLNLKNTGDTTQKDLKISLTSDANLKFLSPYVVTVDELKPGQSIDKTFKIMLGAGVEANTYPLYATLTPLQGGEGQQQIEVAGIGVLGESTGSKPKIIIDSFDYGDAGILAGDAFSLTVRFKNTSSQMGIKNAKVSFDAEGGIFLPIDAANSFFIENIGPGQVVEQTLNLKTKADASVKMYSVDFKIDYEDANGNAYDEKNNPYTATERIALGVKQEVRLEVSDIFLPFESPAGMPLPVEVEFYNMGKSPMYNMMVKLEGNFQAQDSNYFVGNFDPGRSDYFSGTIIPFEPGGLEGQLLFVFEDENGLVQEVAKPIYMTIIEAQDQGEFGQGDFDEVPIDFEGEGPVFPGEEETGFKMPLWAWVLIIGLPLTGVTLVVVKKRKQKRLADLLVDDDEV